MVKDTTLWVNEYLKVIDDDVFMLYEGNWIKLLTDVRREVINLKDNFTDKQRSEIFAEFCYHCGSSNPRCQCWNDE